jgi:hypothetical protein
MYPLNFFNLFPAFPRDNKIFVAMDFDSRFDSRWEEIIKPAVKSIKHKEISLEPYRVDMGKGSDSIPTEILFSISRCQLFFADLTTIGILNKKAIRNGNVMYEIGIAQAVRLPEEVILFRSDVDDNLPFDLANIRVNPYDPDNKPDDAKQKVCNAIESAFKEINLQKHLAVSRVVESLDISGYILLLMAEQYGKVEHPRVRQSENFKNLKGIRDAPFEKDIFNSIPHLLELGLLSTEYTQFTVKFLKKLLKDQQPQEMISYKITPFGSAVIYEILRRNFDTPEAPKSKEELIKLTKEYQFL